MVTENQVLQAIRWKKTAAVTADRLNITEEEWLTLRSDVIKKFGSRQVILDMEEDNLLAHIPFNTPYDPHAGKSKGLLSEDIDIDKGKGHLSGLISDRPLSPEEIEEKYQVDKTKWRLSTYWNKEQPDGRFLVSANITQLKPDQVDPEIFQRQFKEFLTTYTPQPAPITSYQHWDNEKSPIALILPKQDAHFNKYDIMGKNNIHHRFQTVLNATKKLVHKAAATNHIDEVIYVVGSDQFNSEWTGMTTKGTIQTNILTYEGGFTEICNHEISVITFLLEQAEKVSVRFVPGNHDQFVGWHLVSFLQAYFRNQPNVKFDTSILNRKYMRYGTTGIMLNHGDVIKPTDLASKFPIEFKDQWSSCDHFVIVTGDKHHEKSADIHGIKWYQVPQLSNARSYWDDKQGHTCSKAEMTALVVTQTNGTADILKEILIF